MIRWGRRAAATLDRQVAGLTQPQRDMLELAVLKMLRSPYTPSRSEIKRREKRERRHAYQ